MRIVAQEGGAAALGLGEEAGEIDAERGDGMGATAQDAKGGCVRRAAGGIGECHDDTPEAGCDAGGAVIRKPLAFLPR